MKAITTPNQLERGILTSRYKQQVKNNIKIEKLKSLSRIKSMITNHQGKIESQTGTVLRISLFFIAIIMIAY